jgi:hypothetical protein
MIEITNSTRYSIAGSKTKMPSPITEKAAKVMNVDAAAPIQTSIKIIEKMKAISMYVFIVVEVVVDNLTFFLKLLTNLSMIVVNNTFSQGKKL